MTNRLQRRNVGKNGHWYLLDGTYVPGVTTVLGALDKPWMKPWVSGLIADYVAENRDWLRDAPDDDAIRSVLRAVPNNMTRDALLRGTELHSHAETLHRAGTIDLPPGEQADMVQAVAEFLDIWHIETVGVEIPLCNTTKRWAGTTDLIARSKPLARALNLPDDALLILDYKTNQKGIYPESGIQVAAYAQADLAHINGVEQAMPPIVGCALIRVTPTGCEVVPVWPKRMPDLYRLFTAALYVWAATDKKRGWVDTVLAEPAARPEDLETHVTEETAA
jgi:hypothetical protein